MKFESLNYCDIKCQETMSSYTSFKIGGPCDILVLPRNIQGLQSVIEFANKRRLPLIILGNGTNVLIPDKGLPGIVVKIAEPYFCGFEIDNELLKVESGIKLSSLIDITMHFGLSGLEFLAGIPGTLGGAIVMNAGAWGKTVGEYINSVKISDKKGKIQWLKRAELKFGYRESRFKTSAEIILEAEIGLKRENPVNIEKQIQEVLKKRAARLPLEFPNAGCIFKNPPAHKSMYGAGKFIELAGCKGLRVGDAQVSNQHANFIVNLGKSTCADVQTLISQIQTRVHNKFNITLEPEIIIL